MNLAEAMQYVPMEDVISARLLFTDFRPDLVEEVLEVLTPDTFR